ncbi:MAG: hypothetical protein COA49_01090 [Bacteroidetes bacterium]|nr:MAG: hypothetical protein COA49_01090 [Bacteroidota bacterium]
MKIGFVTLNIGTTKGGSEKLWRKLVGQAKEDGHDVIVSIFHHQLEETKLILSHTSDIQEVDFCSRKTYTGKTLLGKVLNKLEELTLGRFETSFFKRDIEPDVCVISCGGMAELGLRRNQKKILNLKVPYSIIIQNNVDEWSFNINSKIAINQIFDGSVKNYFVSQKTLEQAEHQISSKIKNSSLIANPVKAYPEIPLPSSKKVQLAFIGTLDLEVKGVGLLIEALSKPFWKDKDIMVNIYGEGKDRDNISNMIREFGVEDIIILRGWVDDMEEVWSKNHALVSTSFNEGLPMVIQEAMMRGRVVIATDVGGATEIVTDKKSGFIANKPTVDDVELALERWWNDRDNWGEIGKQAAIDIRAFHKHIPQPKTVLNDLIQNG